MRFSFSKDPDWDTIEHAQKTALDVQKWKQEASSSTKIPLASATSSELLYQLFMPPE